MKRHYIWGMMYGTGEAAAIAKITCRVVDHWVRKGLIRPYEGPGSVSCPGENDGKGKERYWRREDLTWLCVLSQLRATGLSLKSLKHLRRQQSGTLRFWVLGEVHITVDVSAIRVQVTEELRAMGGIRIHRGRPRKERCPTTPTTTPRAGAVTPAVERR